MQTVEWILLLLLFLNLTLPSLSVLIFVCRVKFVISKALLLSLIYQKSMSHARSISGRGVIFAIEFLFKVTHDFFSMRSESFQTNNF